jgi:hypothetical protein
MLKHHAVHSGLRSATVWHRVLRPPTHYDPRTRLPQAGAIASAWR